MAQASMDVLKQVRDEVMCAHMVVTSFPSMHTGTVYQSTLMSGEQLNIFLAENTRN